MNKLNILYEDNHVIVVVKPCNVLSQSDNTKDIDLLTLVKEYIKEKYNKPGNVYVGLVHRLDRPVSGVMVFAKTSKAASRLSDQVRLHQVKKKYLAVVEGSLKEEDVFEDYLEKQSDFSTKVVDKTSGKYAKLSYKLLEFNKTKNLSLVDISLETGRHHQIRVQFASRNHALYGDNRYGNYSGEQIALHSYSLTFNHPTTKEELTFEYLPQGEIWRCFKLEEKLNEK